MTDPWGKGCGVEKIMVGSLRGFVVSEEFGSLTGLSGPILGVQGDAGWDSRGGWLVRGWCPVTWACLSTSGALTCLRIQT